MSTKPIQTVLIGCLFVFSLQMTACSPYKGIKNSAYKNINSELKTLKKTGVSDLDLETNYFTGWNEQTTDLNDELKRKFLDQALRGWQVESISETSDGLQADVLLESSDLSFLQPEKLRKEYLPWLTVEAKELQEKNPDITPDQLEERLETMMNVEVAKQIEEAEPEQVELIFTCSSADGSITSIYGKEGQE